MPFRTRLDWISVAFRMARPGEENLSTCTIEFGKTGKLALHVADEANVLDVYRVDSFQASNASMAEGSAQINFRKVLSCPNGHRSAGPETFGRGSDLSKYPR